MLKKLIGVAILFLNFTQVSFAEEPVQSTQKMSAEQFLSSLRFQHGKIDLPNGIASLNLPETFRYLNPQDTEKVLVDAWGNPPGGETLGMILPDDVSPLSADGWGVIITYEEDGHVDDSEADEINYDDLLKDMKQQMSEANEERKKQGYGELNLIGWAEKPSYDKNSHKLYWAKELVFGKSEQHTLNYNIRVLGRKGVLVLNAVAGMNQISEIKTEMQKVVAFTDFNQGNGYTDFDSKTDKVAGYGLAALVAGGVAAKLGFFAKIFALLIAFKKALILGVIAVFAGIKKLIGMSNKDKN